MLLYPIAGSRDNSHVIVPKGRRGDPYASAHVPRFPGHLSQMLRWFTLDTTLDQQISGAVSACATVAHGPDALGEPPGMALLSRAISPGRVTTAGTVRCMMGPCLLPEPRAVSK